MHLLKNIENASTIPIMVDAFFMVKKLPPVIYLE